MGGRSIFAVLFLAGAFVCLDAVPQAPGWHVFQLSDQEHDSHAPRISGRNVTWLSSVDGTWEVFLWNAAAGTTRWLEGSPYGNLEPVISGSTVVWRGGRQDNPYSEIFLYDGVRKTTMQLTESEVTRFNGLHEVSGDRVVWFSADLIPKRSLIYMYEMATGTVTELDCAYYPDAVASPALSGGNVVWRHMSGSETWEVFFNGTRLTYTDYQEASPQISECGMVWLGQVGGLDSDWEVLYFDGDDTWQLTKNDFDDENARISGGNVVWQGWDGKDWEIYFFDGQTLDFTRLTDNDRDDKYPEISGRNVVWQTWDGHDWEVMFHDGCTGIQLSDDDDDDQFPKVSGASVVWTNYSGDPLTRQVMMAVPEVPVSITEPAPGRLLVSWHGDPLHRYRVLESGDLVSWTATTEWVPGDGGTMSHLRLLTSGRQIFFRVERQRLPE